jgi:hypothetical protein
VRAACSIVIDVTGRGFLSDHRVLRTMS